MPGGAELSAATSRSARSMTVWHDDDAFWDAVADKMFAPGHWGAAAEEVPALVELIGLPARSAVLDLACGPGRYAVELARRGFRVTGVDRTAAYLDAARVRAAEEEVELELVESDMREFVRPEAFEAALSMTTSFGYFEDPADDRTVLDHVYASLAPGGAFVLDTIGIEVLARIFQRTEWREVGDDLWLYERNVRDGWSWIDNRWIRISGTERTEWNVGHRLFSASGLEEMMIAAGFSSAVAYGGLDGAPYDHEARRLVVVARK